MRLYIVLSNIAVYDTTFLCIHVSLCHASCYVSLLYHVYLATVSDHLEPAFGLRAVEVSSLKWPVRCVRAQGCAEMSSGDTVTLNDIEQSREQQKL